MQMVCAAVVGFILLTLVLNVTSFYEPVVNENGGDDATWIRMSYGSAEYDLDLTISGDNVVIGDQSGAADDMILYADEKSCVMCIDGSFVIVNGYADTPEVINADEITITNSAGSIEITDGTNILINSNSPAWAYYPDKNGSYTFINGAAENVVLNPSDNTAFAGNFAGVLAYNNYVIGPEDVGDLGLTLDADIVDNVIDSVTWARAVVGLDSRAINPIESNDIDTRGNMLRSADPATGTRIGDLYYTFNESNARVVGYSSEIDWATFTTIPDTVTDGGITYNVTSIGDSAFRDCTSLALTSLPSGLTYIASSAFQGCTSLALTSLPDSITNIGMNAFFNCTSLALTELPSGLTRINDYAFMNCTSLALTELPSGVTNIGALAFQGCTSLALTSLPDSITTIGNRVFYDCTNLKSLVIQSSPTIGTDVFTGCTNLKEILNLGNTEITTTSSGLNADEVRSDIPAMGYIAPLTFTSTEKMTGGIYDLLGVIPILITAGLILAIVGVVALRRFE